MKHFGLKVIVAVFAFVVGITAVFAWTILRTSKPQKYETPAIEQASKYVSLTDKYALTKRKTDSPIGKIDFYNFTYPYIGIKVKGGRVEMNSKFDFLNYTVGGVEYIDFTGDGDDEALVYLREHGGSGSSYTSFHYFVYTMHKSRLHLLWNFSTGSEANGGLKDFRIVKNGFVFELYGNFKLLGKNLEVQSGEFPVAECCPGEYTRIRFEWNGNKVAERELKVFDFPYSSIGEYEAKFVYK